MRSTKLFWPILLVSMGGCGPAGSVDEPTASVGRAIVGGKAAGACEWPTTVALIDDEGICSGTLIHPEIVTTAAHCGTKFTEARLGEAAMPAARVVPIEYCRSYWAELGLDETTAVFGDGLDRAFCKLKTPVLDVPIAPPLMGCETDILKPGQAIVLAGFGITADMKNDDGTKRFVETVVADVEGDRVTVGTKTRTSCEGDSGGPAFVKLADGSFRAFGITNGSDSTPNCAGASYYALIHKAVPWIEQVSGVDVTPCHDADGTWNPSARCGGFSLTPDAPGRSWTSGCTEATLSGPGATCGEPFQGGPREAGSAEAGGGSAVADAGASPGAAEVGTSSENEPASCALGHGYRGGAGMGLWAMLVLRAGGSLRRGSRRVGRSRGPRKHEGLAIYQRAIEFLALAFLIAERAPRDHARLADQLRRAAMSIPLHIAEGYRKPDGPDRRRFYSIGRGSAMECAAILDLVTWLSDQETAPLTEGKNLLIQVVAMLARACD